MFIRYLILLCFLLTANSAIANCDKCNVILISLDTVAAKHMSLYGAKDPTTPNLERFSKRARVFESAYATSPWTLPSHVSMLTGRFPWVVFGSDLTGIIPKQQPHLGQILLSAGYKTAAYTDGIYISRAYGFNRGFQIFDVPKFHKGPIHAMLKSKLDTALQFIQAAKDAPFFVFIHTYAAHEPHTPPASAFSKLYPGVKQPDGFDVEKQHKMNSLNYKASKNDAENLQKLYRAGIYDIDSKVGDFLDSLDKLKVLENTIVVITSDHGQELGEHGGWGLHGTQYYEEVLHIPLIYYSPKLTAKKMSSPVSLIDIAPTIAAELGIKNKTPFDGLPLPEHDSRANLSRMVFAYRLDIDITKAVFPDIHKIMADIHQPFLNALSPEIMKDNPPTDFIAIKDKKKFVFLAKSENIIQYNLSADPNEMKSIPTPCADNLCRLLESFVFKSGVLK